MKDKLASTGLKALVFLLIGVMTAGLAWGLIGLEINSSFLTLEEIMEGTDLYESSYMTSEVMSDAIQDLQTELRIKSMTDNGKTDPNAVIDIAHREKGIHAEDPDPATSYTVRDLYAFADSKEFARFEQNVQNAGSGNFDEAYYSQQAYKLLSKNKKLAIPESEKEAGEISLNDLETEAEEEALDISEYSAAFCYLYSTTKSLETVLPLSGISLAEYALEHADAVSLRMCYNDLLETCYALKEVRAAMQEKQTAGAQKCPISRYWFHDAIEGNVITNCTDWKDKNTQEIWEIVSTEAGINGCYITGDLSGVARMDTFGLNDESLSSIWSWMDLVTTTVTGRYELAICRNPEYVPAPGQPDYADYRRQAAEQMTNFRTGMIVTIISGLLLVVLMILSMIQVGRVYDPSTAQDGDYVVGKGRLDSEHPEVRAYLDAHSEERLIPVRHSSALTAQTPIEILLLVDCIAWGIYGAAIAGFVDILYRSVKYAPSVLIAGCVIGAVVIGLWEVLTFISKAKSHNLTTRSIVKSCFSGVEKVFLKQSAPWQTILAFIGVGLLLFFTGIIRDTGGRVCVLFLFWCVAFVLYLRKSIQKKQLMDGISQISGGNLYYRLEEKKLSGNERIMAGQLNNIRTGMQRAIDEQMKAERLRTDLITNVSHDIKTPLTSIINYVDLLKREQIEDPRIAGYVEVLEQKSARLKQLTEDLVEASKISSGNIVLNCTELDLVQMVKQMNGEYEERFEAKDLHIVTNFSQGEMKILADGARLNRVLDNLYNNTAKYALPGSRVYINVSELAGVTADGTAKAYGVLTMKNISEQELNVSPEELMERFVRGDVSRTSEGSGLGLEIASNLTKMQGGSFHLSVDGDLFKVEVAFPRL